MPDFVTSGDVSGFGFDRTVSNYSKVGKDALVPVVTIMMSLRGNGINQIRTLDFLLEISLHYDPRINQTRTLDTWASRPCLARWI